MIDYRDQVQIQLREIGISLFGECNNRCDFCFNKQHYTDLYSSININQVLSNTIKAIDCISNQTKHINFTLIGGELFQSKFKQDYYNKLFQFINTIRNHCKELNIDYKIGITTNCLCVNDLVIDFLYKANINSLRCSFDFEGRFKSDKIIDNWFGNINKLSKFNPIVELTTMKSNLIKVFNNDPIWIKLYQRYPIEFNNFEDVGIEKYRVTEIDLIDFYKFLIDNYPNVANVLQLKDILSNTKTIRNCRHSIVVTKDYIKFDCCNRNKAIDNFIRNKQCFSCDYYNKCGLTCFREFQNGNMCYLKQSLKYYESWLQTNRF